MDSKKKFQLIELWEQYPVLWDPTDPDRLRKGAQKKAREIIALELGLDEQTVKKTINGLKAQLSGECTKVRKGGKSGAGGSETYSSKWMYYSALQFLIRGKSGAGDMDSLNDTSQHQDDPVEEDVEVDVEEEHGDDHESTSSDIQPSVSTTSYDDQHPISETGKPSGSKPKPVKRNLKRKKSSYDELTLLSKCVDIMSEPTEPKKPKNRANLLGESTTSLLETLWSEDLALYNEYAVALRNLNNKFEQTYEERLIRKLSQEQMIVLTSESYNMPDVGFRTGNSEVEEITTELPKIQFPSEPELEVEEITTELPKIQFPSEPELD